MITINTKLLEKDKDYSRKIILDFVKLHDKTGNMPESPTNDDFDKFEIYNYIKRLYKQDETTGQKDYLTTALHFIIHGKMPDKIVSTGDPEFLSRLRETEAMQAAQQALNELRDKQKNTGASKKTGSSWSYKNLLWRRGGKKTRRRQNKKKTRKSKTRRGKKSRKNKTKRK